MTKAKTKTTHVLMVIDKSGSMYHLRDDVMGGFNQYIDTLKKDAETRYRVTVVTFNTIFEHLCMDAALKNVPALDDTNYEPTNGTALNDAVGNTLTSFDDKGTDKVLVVVHTDGFENSSREWTTEGIRELVDGKPKDRWGFVFLGAHQDAWKQGHSYGMAAGQTINTSAGTRSSYSSLGAGTRAYSAGTATAQGVTKMSSEASMATADDESEEETK